MSSMHFAMAALGGAHQLEAIFIMYRRMMLGIIKDPSTVMLAIVLTGLEEVIVRSTMVHRDRFFRWLQGLPDPTEEELLLERRFWAASIGCSFAYSTVNYANT